MPKAKTARKTKKKLVFEETKSKNNTPLFRCEWCGNISKNKSYNFSYQGSGHTDRARVCSSYCGQAWREKAANEAKRLDELFSPAPARIRKLTARPEPSIIKSVARREVRNYGTQAR